MKFVKLISRNLHLVYTNWLPLTISLAVPIALVIIFESIYGTIPYSLFTAQSLAPGVVVFSLSYLTLFSAYLISKDVEDGFLNHLKDLSVFTIIRSYQIPFLLVGFFQMTVTLITGAFLGGIYHQIIESTVFYMLFASLMVSVGLIIGLNFNPAISMTIGSVFTLVDALFCGAWLDVNMLGSLFKTLAYYLPFANGVDISRAMLKGVSINLYYTQLSELIFYFIILTLLLVISLRLKRNAYRN